MMQDDLIRPFQIEGRDVRGRLVRLGPALDTVLTRHNYPAPVATLLGEAMALAAGLAGGLKFDGVFTLQASGDGPIRVLVADVTTDGAIRGYASYDAERLPAAGAALPELLGVGYLSFTVDQGRDTERYQGIVSLEGARLADCVHHYFHQSEQIPTTVNIACGRIGGAWRAGALVVQKLPPAGSERGVAIEGLDDDDTWRLATALVGSATPDEMLAPALAPDELLWRLFHESGVRAYKPMSVVERCRCSRDRIERVLRALDRQEVESLGTDGRIEVTCEFCSRSETFTEADLDAIYDT